MIIIPKKVHKVQDGLSLYYAGDIAVIVMDRVENRINDTLLNAFNALLDDVESNKSCKGLITTGKGKFYSNGLDLDLIMTLTQEKAMLIFTGLLALLKRIIFFPIPTLAAINGHAFAGGALLVFAHDVRTMNADKGWICFNEVFIDRRFGKFNLTFLEAKLGKGNNYTDMLVLGKRFTAQEALRRGLIHAYQAPRLLMQDSFSVLKSFYGNGFLRESLTLMKEDVYREALECYESEGIDNSLETLKRNSISAKL